MPISQTELERWRGQKTKRWFGTPNEAKKKEKKKDNKVENEKSSVYRVEFCILGF